MRSIGGEDSGVGQIVEGHFDMKQERPRRAGAAELVWDSRASRSQGPTCWDDGEEASSQAPSASGHVSAVVHAQGQGWAFKCPAAAET